MVTKGAAGLFMYLLLVVFSLGITKIGIIIADDEVAEFRYLFSCLHLTVKGVLASLLALILIVTAVSGSTYLGASLGLSKAVVGFLTIGTLILLFTRISLFMTILVDQENSPVEAITQSFKLTEGNFWKIVILYVLVSFINTFSSLDIFGMFGTVTHYVTALPIYCITAAYIYRKLSNPQEEPKTMKII